MLRRAPVLLRVLAAVVAVVSCSQAQDPVTIRYELGKRVRRFERAFAALPADPAARSDAVAAMGRAVEACYSLDIAATSRALDDGVLAMRAGGGAGSLRALLALTLRLDTHLVTGGTQLGMSVVLDRGFDRTDEDSWPSGEPIELEVIGAGAPQTFTFPPPTDGPHRLVLTVPVGDDADLNLRARFKAGRLHADYPEQTLARVHDAGARIRTLEAVVARDDHRSELEHTTLEQLVRLLRSLAAGRSYETDLPAARLCAEAEAVAVALTGRTPFYGDQHHGEFWLSIPTGSRATAVRIFVPPARPDAPRALVLALHGIGGSENLFFDAHGDGLARRLCAEEGWILCAPRLLEPAQTKALLDQLHARYAFDPDRVFLIGHSMGAWTAQAAAEHFPESFAKIAVLCPQLGYLSPEDFRRIPLWIGTADGDFARAGALQLRDALTADGNDRFEFHDLPTAEHMLVVQLALPAVFDFFRR